jgi:hypothetical protein
MSKLQNIGRQQSEDGESNLSHGTCREIEVASFTRRAFVSAVGAMAVGVLGTTLFPGRGLALGSLCPPHNDLPHGDLVHGDLPHGDIPHTDLPHSDIPHTDLDGPPHFDLPHGDLPHGDIPYTDL